MASVGEEFPKELARARAVLKMYEEIPAGAFGAAMIRQDIADAEAALASGDVVAMLRSFQKLKDIKS